MYHHLSSCLILIARLLPDGSLLDHRVLFRITVLQRKDLFCWRGFYLLNTSSWTTHFVIARSLLGTQHTKEKRERRKSISPGKSPVTTTYTKEAGTCSLFAFRQKVLFKRGDTVQMQCISQHSDYNCDRWMNVIDAGDWFFREAGDQTNAMLNSPNRKTLTKWFICSLLRYFVGWTLCWNISKAARTTRAIRPGRKLTAMSLFPISNRIQLTAIWQLVSDTWCV